MRTRDIIRNKGGGNYIITKRPILQEDKIILYVFAPNNRASKYVRQKLINLKKEMDPSTIIIRDFKGPLSKIDSSNRQQINKDAVGLNSTVNHLYLTDIYKYSIQDSIICILPKLAWNIHQQRPHSGP